MADPSTDREADHTAADAVDGPADEPPADAAGSVPEAAFDVAPELFGAPPADSGARDGSRRPDDTAL